jgi:hypothetical protein
MVTSVSSDWSYGGAEHALWNGEPARPNHPASSGQGIRDEAAGAAASHMPADASVDPTEARKSMADDPVINRRG